MKASTIAALVSLLFSCLTMTGHTAEPASLTLASAQHVTSESTQTVLKDEDTRTLLNWAIHLSRYEKPAQLPKVLFVPHKFLVDSACFGVECKVLGWYNDTGIVYIDDRFRDNDSLFSNSLIVHEMIHFLQHQSGEYTQSCLDVAAREKEAYWIQQEYHIANGTFGQLRPHYYRCDVLAVQE